MRTSPQRLTAILAAAHYEGTLILKSADLREICGKVDWAEAYGMAIRGEIEAIGRSNNPIRYFRVLRPEERPEAPLRPITGVSRQTAPMPSALHPFYEDQIGEFQVGTLCRVTAGGQLLRWSDQIGFNPLRFNPDRIPAPLFAFVPR